jgi:5-methylcytosine-specific restriction endonuclease McrA
VTESELRALVVDRALNRCEYCHLPQDGYEATFHIEHVYALQHIEDHAPENLALSCPKCNRKKGPNLSGLDPLTRSIVPLFHPRRDKWADHFRWNGPLVIGLTPCGRATIAVTRSER